MGLGELLQRRLESDGPVRAGLIGAGKFGSMFLSQIPTSPGLEVAVIADLDPDGLAFPPCGTDDLPHVLRPSESGGRLHHAGQVEVVSSLERDGRPVFRDLRWGVYVILEAPNPYAADCFRQYGLLTDDTGRYAAMYKPYHLIGLELNISILSAALRGEATGCAAEFRADVVATAKRPLRARRETEQLCKPERTDAGGGPGPRAFTKVPDGG